MMVRFLDGFKKKMLACSTPSTNTGAPLYAHSPQQCAEASPHPETMEKLDSVMAGGTFGLKTSLHRLSDYRWLNIFDD